MYSTIVHLLAHARRHAQRTDVVVVGGGVAGIATALALARRGVGVLVLEQFSLRAAAGSSRGTARIYAPAPYPDEGYFDAGLRALERWRELESASGERLLCETGAIHSGEFAAGISAEPITPKDAERRFAVKLAGDSPAVFQADAGVIRADRAWAVLVAMARDAGVRMNEGERVLTLGDDGDEVIVETDLGEARCATAVVAAGPWAAPLLADAGIDAALDVSLQTVAYFEGPPRARPRVALIDYEGAEPYACWDPERGLKAALHARGPVHDPNDAQAEVADPSVLGEVGRWVSSRYPGIAATPTAADTCMYTNAPGERFVLERHGRIVVGSACSGQGFQFAPETGEGLAELAAEVVIAERAPAAGPR